MMAIVLPDKPIAFGGGWSYVEPKDKETGNPGLKVDYVLVGEEKVGRWETYKITSRGVEDGEGNARSEATFWIEKSSGARIRVRTKLVNERISEGDGPIVITTDLERQP